ncbi:MAG TPA: hypothetical protein PLQ93_00405 [Bacteroidia bacterium]|nr:hypothetical protein [Bacteroidia bacterium]
MSWRLLSVIMGYIMLVLVFGGAMLFTFSPFMQDELYGTKRWAFILILILYGCYRAYRLYLIHRQSNHHEA